MNEVYVIVSVSGLALAILIGWLVHLGRRVSQLEASVRKVETDVKHLPTREDIHGLSLTLESMRAEGVSRAENMRSILFKVERMETHLLNYPYPRREGANL
jgi:hypothetical protein